MIIKKYGLVLRRVREQDLEMLRLERNSLDIRQHMFYDKTITKEEQLKWFETINNEKNYFKIIEVKGQQVGLVSSKIDDFEKGNVDVGIFIWNKDFLASKTAVAAALCGLDFIVMLMRGKKLFTQVKYENKRAIGFNRYLGFENFKEYPEENKLMMAVSANEYLAKTERIRNWLLRQTGDTKPMSWDDFEFSFQNKEFLQRLPQHIYEEIELEKRLVN